jgi:outer membrane biogenesis lipoprotein LolB
MRQTLTGLFVAAALLLPNCLLAQHRDDDRRDHPDEHRYYDKKHKDYHEWNDHESQAYRMYQQDHHNRVDWDRANEHQRNDYWKWRHNHSDSILKINIR